MNPRNPEWFHRYERFLRNKRRRYLSGVVTVCAATYLVFLVATGPTPTLLLELLALLVATGGLFYCLFSHFVRTDAAFVATTLNIPPGDLPGNAR